MSSLWAPENVRTLREELDVSQAELARLLEIDRSSIWRWEHGRVTPRACSRRKIKRLLGMVSSA